ncbi:hypothetical protein [Luteimonas salinilitoris]|uniref:Uncharacterized protein n=1 Tax=Luteimonas salinilitoris TaxID=3237697 RepID=A0ABV4HNU6_9GAMM
MKLDRIRFDGVAWDFSEYFDYIKSVENMLPQPLRDYSIDLNSYALHGTKTLHDARILSAVIEKRYDDKFSNVTASVELNFIDQLFEGVTTLRYVEVSSYIFKEIDLSTNRHADVLVHEFSVVSTNLFRHRIIFDHSGEVEIEFRSFFHAWNKLNS